MSDEPSQNALLALKAAALAAKSFDRTFTHKHPEREVSIALLYSQEVLIDPVAAVQHGYYREIPIKALPLRSDLAQGTFGTLAQMARERLAERLAESPHYCCKFLQQGLVDQPEHGAMAAAEMIMEVKLLMNLEPHPHISQIYACNAKGIDSFLDKGFHSFFFVTDRLSETLPERMERVWRKEHVSLNERLEIGLDISSGLRFLHDRKIVYYLRPEKIGFDLRHNGRVKLCHFSQARQEGMKEIAPSITKSDDVVHVLAYTAPEVLCNAPITCSSDVYAFAILLWEIITLRRPFEGFDRFHHYARAVQAHERPPLESVSSKNLSELLSTAWHPHLRPTMKTLNETLEAMLLSDPDDDAIHVSELLGKKQRALAEPESPLSRRPISATSKTRSPADNSTRSARSIRSNKSSASESPVKRVSYQRSSSLTKLTINGNGSPLGRLHHEEASVDTTPTVRSSGSTGTNSVGVEHLYASPASQRGRVPRGTGSQSSPSSNYSGKVSALPRSGNASGASRSENSSSSSPGGTFSDDVPWKTIKTPKVFARRKSTSHVQNDMQSEAWLPDGSPQSITRQTPPLPSPSPRRRHHRSASMDFAPKSTFDDFSPMSSSEIDASHTPRRTLKQKSKRRASLSSPPSSEFKLDMVPEPTPMQRKKASAAGGSPSVGFMGLDNIGSPTIQSIRKTKTSGLPTIAFDSPPSNAKGDTSQNVAGPRRGKSPKPTKSKEIVRGKSPAPGLSNRTPTSSGGLRRRPSLRKSASGREILSSPPMGNSPGSDEDRSAFQQDSQQQHRVLRKSASRRRMSNDGAGSAPLSDEDQFRGRQASGVSGLANDIVSDNDARGSFTSRLRAEMKKKDPTGSVSGKIRVKVTSKKANIP